MLTRRAATALLTGIAAAPSGARSANSRPGAVFYNAVGPGLTCWHADIGTAALTRQDSVTITVDAGGNWLLTAYNLPSAMSVHPLGPDGAIGAEISQASPIDCGVYAHQIRMMPSDRYS
jgi:hypothetical protein